MSLRLPHVGQDQAGDGLVAQLQEIGAAGTHGPGDVGGLSQASRLRNRCPSDPVRRVARALLSIEWAACA